MKFVDHPSCPVQVDSGPRVSRNGFAPVDGSQLRQELIERGALRPDAGPSSHRRPRTTRGVLRLDHVGRAYAEKHQADYRAAVKAGILLEAPSRQLS